MAELLGILRFFMLLVGSFHSRVFSTTAVIIWNNVFTLVQGPTQPKGFLIVNIEVGSGWITRAQPVSASTISFARFSSTKVGAALVCPAYERSIDLASLRLNPYFETFFRSQSSALLKS
jgi:hypothetical protein